MGFLSQIDALCSFNKVIMFLETFANATTDTHSFCLWATLDDDAHELGHAFYDNGFR